MVNEEYISIWNGNSYLSSSPATASVPIISSTLSSKMFPTKQSKYYYSNTQGTINQTDKVKIVTMFANKDQGGLNMPNIQYQDTWVKRLVCQSKSNWAKLALVHLPPGGDTIFKGNI